MIIAPGKKGKKISNQLKEYLTEDNHSPIQESNSRESSHICTYWFQEDQDVIRQICIA
jgi:hypothetical protein